MPSYEKVSQAEPFSDAQKQSPWRSLLSVYAAQMSGALALGIAQPFIPALCKRWEIDEDYIGIASGLLVGIFPLATFLSNTPLGHLSDIYGRKKLLLLGLATGAIGTAAFGVVQNFWLALLVRFVAGLTNSTMALSKAVVADLTTGKQRTLAFAYLGSTLSLARTISGTIGGLTAGIVIADNVPVLDNPYMLPLLIGSCINTVSFFAAVVFVPETRSKGGKKREGGSMLQGIREIAGDRLMRRLVTVFCLNSFGNSGILLVFALYFALEVEYHGLGFTPFQIGLYLTAFGGVAFLFQMLIFKRLLSRWSVVRIYEVGTILLGVGTTITPVSGFFYWFGGKTFAMDVCTYLVLAASSVLFATGFMTALPMLNTMQSNAAVSDRQGLLQGTIQSTGSLVRALGPLLCGGIFSATVAMGFPALLWWLLTLMFALCYYLTSGLSTEDLARCMASEGESASQKVLVAEAAPDAPVPPGSPKPDEIELLETSALSDSSEPLSPGAASAADLLVGESHGSVSASLREALAVSVGSPVGRGPGSRPMPLSPDRTAVTGSGSVASDAGLDQNFGDPTEAITSDGRSLSSSGARTAGNLSASALAASDASLERRIVDGLRTALTSSVASDR